jgi:hypothetical protein
MRAILPVHISLIDKPQVSLIHQSRRLHRVRFVTAMFPLHVLMSQLMQLLIDQRSQPIECGLTSIAPSEEQVGKFFGGRNHDE